MGAGNGRLALLAALTLLILGSGAQGWAGSVVVIGNLSETNDKLLTAVATIGTYSKAVGFTMGATPYELDSISLRLKEQAGSQSSLSVELFGGKTSPAGPVLVSFDTPAIPTTTAKVTFQPTTDFVLQANTSYWIYVSGTSNTLDGIDWYANSPGVAPTGVATAVGALFSASAAGLSSLASSGTMNSFAVLGGPLTIVPEPRSLIPAATAVLMGLAYAGWRQCHRGRRAVG